MKRLAWRLVKEKHAATAFSGEGAARYGGRWNSRGTWVVYTSSSRALAALESLVHLNPPLFFRYVLFTIEFDASLIETIPVSQLPPDWAAEPPPPAPQQLGDRWVRETRSAILEVPSTIIPQESNYLLNPAHPDFKSIRIGKPEPFDFDPRLIKHVS